ncbi:MAG: restriction endonuclease subunit S [Bacteroidaceae bacterium]
MQTYEKYKDSGVAWIGEIPYHWDVVSLKRSLRIKNGCDYKTIQVDEGGYPVIGSGGEFARASKYLYDGEVVLLGRKGTIDKPLYYEGQFWVVDTMFYGIPLNNCFGKYLYFQSRTIPFNRYSTNTALPSMTQTDLNSHSICLPTFAEQQCIASYLDKKCANIDKVISTQRSRIELLQELKQSTITHAVTHGLNSNVKMKDSGVEWIGEVPEHWKVMKSSLMSSLIGSGTTPNTNNKDYYCENEEEGYNWLQTGDLNNGLIISTLKKVTLKAVKECNLKFYTTGSIVIAMYGATIGKVGILGFNTAVNQACCVLSKTDKIVSKFVFYLFLSAKESLLISAIGGGQPNISQDVIKKLKVVVPPLSEQQAIATYLDKKCAELDNSISKAQKEIDLLQEYKQALVTEVVTGKRKVC